jgi:alpha-L-fucosidase
MVRKTIFLIIIASILLPSSGYGQILNLNKPEREEWFSELGFGMFIHWSYDVVLGMVISHSLVGASDDYENRYFNELPGSFNPGCFAPSHWAKIAKMAGMKYVVFTTKHHNGFCMFDTKTTDYDVMHTPYGKDITKMVLDAFRKEGLAVGIYYSPDDFYFLHKQKKLISRVRPHALPSNNPELLEYDKRQMHELMTNYGNIDIVFLDGNEQFGKTELARVCWEINPDVVVTRGAMETPEQKSPDTPLPPPWEACYTLGDQWQYRPTNENYKSARRVIELLIDVRANGGNLLLNIGPDQNGIIPPEQEGILNEIALWMFINGEALVDVESCNITREGNILFLKKKNGNTVFAFILETDWKFGDRKEFLLQSVQAGKRTEMLVLGHGGIVLEYNEEADPSVRFSQTEDGLLLSVMRAQRIYNDRKWPNPIVVKMENVSITP